MSELYCQVLQVLMTESEINCPIQENSIDKRMKCLVTLFWLKAMSSCILEKYIQISLSSLFSILHVNSNIIFCICAWWLEEMICSRIYLLIIISKLVYWVDCNVMRIFDTWLLYLCFRLMYICQFFLCCVFDCYSFIIDLL